MWVSDAVEVVIAAEEATVVVEDLIIARFYASFTMLASNM